MSLPDLHCPTPGCTAVVNLIELHPRFMPITPSTPIDLRCGRCGQMNPLARWLSPTWDQAVAGGVAEVVFG